MISFEEIRRYFFYCFCPISYNLFIKNRFSQKQQNWYMFSSILLLLYRCGPIFLELPYLDLAPFPNNSFIERSLGVCITLPILCDPMLVSGGACIWIADLVNKKLSSK